MRAPLVGTVIVGVLLAGCTSGAPGPTGSAGLTAPAPSSPAPASGTSVTTGGPASSEGPLPVTAADWPMYHGDPAHDGVYQAMPPATDELRVITALHLDGAVYASPIVVGGITVVATENDTVYAFDRDYRQLWRARLGSPSPAPERPCGNIDPLGITGTPIYSPQTGDVYVAVEHGGTIRHDLVALDLDTGAVRWTRNVDLPGADPVAMQQRGALAITGDRVWVSFGALFGDCGDYKGRVVGVRVDGTGAPVAYTPPTKRQGGIWNPAGPTVDARGHLLVVSANGAAFPGDDYDHTNSVLDLTANGRLTDSFAPTDWAQNNEADAGLGSQGVALIGTDWAVLGGKSGPVYVLAQGHLGGIGGQVDVANVCRSFGGAAVAGDVVYLPCTDGVRAVRVDDAGQLHVLWHTADSIAGSPVVGGGRVWALDQAAGVLHALDPSTGRSRAQVSVGTVTRFATPAFAGRDVLVPTTTGLVVVAAD